MTIVQKIDVSQCSCDDLPIGKTLISIDEALSQIEQSASPVIETEDVTLAFARGRILARAVQSRGMAPPFDNAAMDGYAIDTSSLLGDGPWRLDVAHRIAAGQPTSDSVSGNRAAQIFTGAPIPDGADAVVMQEHVAALNGTIILARKPDPGVHIRRAGEDIAAGETVVPAGRRLTARDIATCAAAGHASVVVRRRPKVALLVTGNEITAPGEARNCAAIWDVNSPMLTAELATPCIDFIGVAFGADDRNDLGEQLAALVEDVDLIISTGGISVGEEDHVKDVLADLGGTLEFSGVAVKPGKPISYGRIGGTHWLGLPGNPLSACLMWEVIGKALCRRIAGESGAGPQRRSVVLANALSHKPGRCELRLAQLKGFDELGREKATFDEATYSGHVSSLPKMDGFMLIPADAGSLPEGSLVEFYPFCDS